MKRTAGKKVGWLVTIDGKTMRGTIPKGCTQGTRLLAAYLPEEGIVLKQVMVESKENEISAAPQLVKALDLKNKVICDLWRRDADPAPTLSGSVSQRGRLSLVSQGESVDYAS